MFSVTMRSSTVSRSRVAAGRLFSGEKRFGLRIKPAIIADSERSSCALGLPKYAWLAVSMPYTPEP